MAAVTICSDFGAPSKIKSFIVSIVSPSICHEVMGPYAMILGFKRVTLAVRILDYMGDQLEGSYNHLGKR